VLTWHTVITIMGFILCSFFPLRRGFGLVASVSTLPTSLFTGTRLLAGPVGAVVTCRSSPDDTGREPTAQAGRVAIQEHTGGSVRRAAVQERGTPSRRGGGRRWGKRAGRRCSIQGKPNRPNCPHKIHTCAQNDTGCTPSLSGATGMCWKFDNLRFC